VIFPYFGSVLILVVGKEECESPTGAALDAYRVAETQVVEHAYLGLALVPRWRQASSLPIATPLAESIIRAARSWAVSTLARPRFAFGVACIFLYVGAEVSIGSLIVNYMKQAHVLGLDEQSAGKMIPFYWGGLRSAVSRAPRSCA
jgi:FHS family L-fucose permease-like MFS transporter